MIQYYKTIRRNEKWHRRGVSFRVELPAELYIKCVAEAKSRRAAGVIISPFEVAEQWLRWGVERHKLMEEGERLYNDLRLDYYEKRAAGQSAEEALRGSKANKTEL